MRGVSRMVDSVEGDVDALRAYVRTLTDELEAEQRQLAAAEDTHVTLKRQYAITSLQGETEEEYISNKLTTLLQDCKAEKEKLAMQIEQEEEYLTNTLQMKLEQLKREKLDIENQLEQEQEYIVNKLQLQLDDIRAEKEALERRIDELTRIGSVSPPSSPHHSRRRSSSDRVVDPLPNATPSRAASAQR